MLLAHVVNKPLVGQIAQGFHTWVFHTVRLERCGDVALKDVI